MNFKYSLALFLGLTVLSTGACFAQATTDVRKFTRTDEYRLQKAQGNTNFPDDIRTVERMDGVSYKKNDYMWTIDHAKNQITYRKFKALGTIEVMENVKKTPDEILAFAKSGLIALSWINASYYPDKPEVFHQQDAKCGTPNFKPYCSYPNSYIVFYPYWYQNLPVYNEDGSVLGLVVVLDHFNGNVLYASGLIGNQTELADVTGENLLTASQINAYVARTRLFDGDTYLVPASVGTTISFVKDLTKYGFSPLTNGVPVVQVKEPEPEVVVTPSESGGKIYNVDGLTIYVPDDKGFETRGSVLTGIRYKSIPVFQTGGKLLGRIVVLSKTQTTYKNVLVRRGATQLFETETQFVVFLPVATANKDLVKSVMDNIDFNH